MRGKYLSATIKRKRTPMIIMRDYPDGSVHKCCYCGVKFDENIPKRRLNWEHLDDNKTNQQLWNLGWTCYECNQRKKNDYDLKIRGMDLTIENKKWEELQTLESISVCEKTAMRNNQKISEIDISPVLFEIAQNFLLEKLDTVNKRLTIKLSADTIAARCIKKLGQGSPVTARRNLDILSTEEFIYKIEKIEGQNYIMIDVPKYQEEQKKKSQMKITEQFKK